MRDSKDRFRGPLYTFFDSLGSALRDQSIGIVLSGTGSDGALGLKAIKECGGLTIAQGSEGSAPQYGEMPAGAIATGAVDLVAQIEDIPGHLLRIKGSPPTVVNTADDSDGAVDAARLKILCDSARPIRPRFQRLSRQDVLTPGAASHAGGGLGYVD